MTVGLLGGTFDPIHAGHLDAARAARRALALDEVWLLPARVPPHRGEAPRASAYHRFAMVALAALDQPGLVASDLELLARAPSFTAATLGRLAELGHDPSQLFFITGSDAIAEIATWRDYPRLLDRAHFVAVARPGFPPASLRQRLPGLAERMIDISPAPAEPVAMPAKPSIFLLDAATMDVSSTAIRRRLVEGLPVTGLVPESVVRHIRQHHLYSPHAPAADDLHDQS